MKNLLIAFGLMVFMALPANAQYESMVDAKITQLEQMQVRVQNSGLSEADSTWATAQFRTHRALLMAHRETTDIEKLKSIESNINQVNAVIAQKVMAIKKLRMTQKLEALEAMIVIRKADGQDTTALELLREKMKATLQNL